MRKIPQNFMLGGQLDMSYWLELPNLHFFHQQIRKMPPEKVIWQNSFDILREGTSLVGS